MKSREEVARDLTERYAEGLAAIDAGNGPGWLAALAQAVRGGERPNEWADQNGKARSTVYQWLSDPHKIEVRRRKGTYVCEGCGETKPHDGRVEKYRFCIKCWPLEQRRVSREHLISEIRLWAEKYGRPPAAMDWNFAPSVQDRLHPERLAELRVAHAEHDWPSPTQAQYLFGSWSNAIKAAGFTPTPIGKRVDPESWKQHLKGRTSMRTPEEVMAREIEKLDKKIESREAEIEEAKKQRDRLKRAQEVLSEDPR